MENKMSTGNIPSSKRKSLAHPSFITDDVKSSVQYISPLAYFYNLGFFLFIVPFRVKWNKNEGCYTFYTNKFQNVRVYLYLNRIPY